MYGWANQNGCCVGGQSGGGVVGWGEGRQGSKSNGELGINGEMNAKRMRRTFLGTRAPSWDVGLLQLRIVGGWECGVGGRRRRDNWGRGYSKS